MTRILIIEDLPNFREGLAEILQLNRYDVVTAQDGVEGIRFAREYLPDLILCDIMMPELDGYEVLRELRNESSTASIPFIFLTAKADPNELRLGMELGADDYITKPFRESELLAAIKTRLQRHALLEAQQLRTLSRRFLLLQENDRRALAQRIHDEITQPLAGLNLTLQGIRQVPFQQLDQELAKLQTIADSVMTQVTVTAEDLWPIILDDLGLLPAMLHQFEQFSARTGIKVNLIHRGLDRDFSLEVKITTYRVIEEILSNAAQYAQVEEVMVNAWVDEAMLQIEFVDQGVGFDLESLLGARSASGLAEIRERVFALGGDLVITSSPGTGVRVSAKIPCNDVAVEISPQENPFVSNSPRSLSTGEMAALDAVQADTTTVFVAEENEIIRQGLIRLLETDFSIVGEGMDRSQVANGIRYLQPDVLILGITMAGVSTLDLIQPALQVRPDLRVLIFSSNPNEIYAYEALRHGASGYMLNTASTFDIREAVRVVARGDEYWSAVMPEESIRQRVDMYQAGDPEMDTYNALTSREREILTMVAQGYTSKQIAGSLSISPRTAETHRSNVARKLGLRTQSDLIRYAIKHGLIRSEQ